MHKIPEDIIKRLQNDFSHPQDYQEALRIVRHVRSDRLNVGWVQLTRAMIVLAEGNVDRLKEFIRTDYMGDPRDLIMAMMNKPNTNNDHGSTAFSD